MLKMRCLRFVELPESTDKPADSQSPPSPFLFVSVPSDCWVQFEFLITDSSSHRYLSDNAAAKLKEESPEQRDQRVCLQGAVITILVLLGLTLKICFHGVITDQEIFRPQDLSQLITFNLNAPCWCWSQLIENMIMLLSPENWRFLL